LKTGQDEVEILVLNGGSKRTGRSERVKLEEFRIENMDAAIGALGESFLDGLLGALGAHGDGHDLASMLFLQAQRLFQREAIRLVGFKSDVGFANPRAAIGDGQWRVFGGNLLDANTDFHD
jgi:hypothetical protein